MATLTVYPDGDPETTTVDGIAFRNATNESWATITAGAGTGNNSTSTSGNIISITSDATLDRYSQLIRAIYLFDTSSLTSGVTVTAAVLSIFGSSKADNLAITPDIDIYTSTPATNTDIANSDYSQVGSTSQTGSPITYAAWNTAAYNDFTLNATGISNVSKTSVSKFGARNANYDVSGVAPTWTVSTFSNIRGNYADNAGTTNDPKLTVTYLPTIANPIVTFRVYQKVI